ncbi:ATP-binding protein [Paenibacillus thiaminolyticus]|nr:ATP-binding protein [Paenibacillus thiaminolyticus]
MRKQIPFKPKARLLLQLGDQLIKNENVALLELVKNSYDADSKLVKVSMSRVTDPKIGEIVILDDGNGMDINIIENVWMEPGSNFKEDIFKSKKRSKLNRLPIGEKGIGRFGVHKLGNRIELISRMENQKEVVFNINWNDFSTTEYLDDVKISIFERDPELFIGEKTGTRIVISDLKNTWTRGAIRSVYRAINSLCSPFNSIDKFEVEFNIDQPKWLENLTDFHNIKQFALYEADITIEGDYITKFLYKFKPWSVFSKLSSREHNPTEPIRIITKKEKKKNEFRDVMLSKYNIGTVKIKLYIFDRDSSTLKLAIHDKTGYKEYLDQNGGIRVYRDKMRVYDYGEEENDWLRLDYGRFNSPGTKISNNLVIGAVDIDREQSFDLIEKTNREGFIENEAYQEFKAAIEFAVEKVEQQRRIDKEKIRTYYSPTSKSEPVIANLNLLQNSINQNVKDTKLKQELVNHVKRIEDDYKHITDVYIKSAGAGLSLSIAIHEMQKIIQELVKATDFEKTSIRISDLVTRLSQLVEGYSTLFKGKDKKKQSLAKIIDAALFNVEYRLKVHNVNIVNSYTKYSDVQVNCTKNLLISTIVNIIDNSIWWLDYNHIESKEICIAISFDIPDRITILIADNGLGFSLPTEDIVKPFITDRPEGMGLGLYLANEILRGHEGNLIFPEYDDVELPETFKNGAIIGLAFKEEK